jgi:hypothetical protein
MKKTNYKEVLEIACRLYVFFFLTAYGVGKLVGGQFYTPGSIPAEIETMPIGQIPDFDLAWVFMGRSFGYIFFIAIAEVAGALMLLFNRTKLVGTLVLIPIMVNVIVFDVFFLDEYGALASAVIYLLMLLLILLLNRGRVLKAIESLTQLDAVPKAPAKEMWVKFSLVLLTISVAFVFNQVLVNWLGYGKG